ncbi:hypothetical protein PPTG_03279 [Phytophthora nicotianae INRA-310]|uniref:PiggyBac transposable element-derived protein domain-containing protein n=1 Tax=Phytophthora nicotianae (strain INRA-310) TaxID=761204 RepID=W2R693_PHYN3|nr:hypothetical protein PPTG_03279 [Phytophthora nicotianae INRA-310]ETN20234.1 hypothetical protein PPTG_03279 [Phytophthora nicotianae INRA-310]
MNTLCESGDLDAKSATALWVAMLARQNQQLPTTSGKRVVVMDSYYTRHSFAKHILQITSGEIRVVVESAVVALDGADHGSWKLVAAIEPVDNVKEAEKAHKQNQKHLKKSEKTPFVPQLQRSPHAGYIVFRDKRVVLFYTNDLAVTPLEDILDGSAPEAQACCRGISFVQRWTGTKVFRRSNVRAPTHVAIYNKFMNDVDRFDQMRSTNPTRRRGKRLHMSIFTWLLDLAIHNAFTLSQTFSDGNGTGKSIRSAKEEIVAALVSA